MVKLLHILLFSLCSNFLWAQISIERQVISPTGSFGTGSFLISATVGQPEYTTGTSSNHALTAGFQQPSVQDPIVIELAIEQPGCQNDGLGTIMISQLGGCAGNSAIVLLNGEEVELPVSGLEEGSYTLEVNAGFNCSYSEDLELVLSDQFCDLAFFNVITPNNDGQNDQWNIENITDFNDGRNTVSIINRWGNEVFSAANYNNVDVVWKGNNKDGKALPAATYFYIVNIADQQYTGYIELLK